MDRITLKTIALACISLAAAILFSACPLADPLELRAEIEERVAAAGKVEATNTLTIMPGVNGIVVPVGAISLAESKSQGIAASVNSGYSFYRWEKISGEGSVTFANLNSISTTVSLTGGDATIQAVIDDTNFVVTVSNDGHGTTNPSPLNVTKDVASGTLTATPGAEYTFLNWTVTSGSGIVFSNANSATTTVTASAGDATIRANFIAETYPLTMTSDGNGYTSASATVSPGIAKAIVAYPYSTYVFNGWTKTAGTGTATFGNSAQASTTVTVAGGPVTIRANFRKENITTTETGSLGPLGDSSTNPANVRAYWLDGASNSLYVAGDQELGSDSVVRKLSVASSVAPSSGGFNEYKYLTGQARKLESEGTNLFIGTDTNLYRTALSGFTVSSTEISSVVSSLKDFALDTLASDSMWVATLTTLQDYSRSSLTLNGYVNVTDFYGWKFDRIAANNYGVYAVLEDNGANLFGGYDIDVVSGATLNTPSSSIVPHNGTDMEPGNVLEPVFNEDREVLALPVLDDTGTWWVKLYDSTSPVNMDGSDLGTVQVNGSISRISWYGSYIYAAGEVSGVATVWIIDAYSVSAPVIRKTVTISGFAEAQAAFEHAGSLWVLLDNAGGIETKIALKAFSITRN